MHVDLTDYQLTKEDKERIHLLSIVEKKGLKPLNLENLRLLERLVEKKDYGTSKKAKSENKPIFLSVGYSSCHWCHVMAHESFENEDIARVLNDNFINIKVDREERPDIDDIYQKACQMVTGRSSNRRFSRFSGLESFFFHDAQNHVYVLYLLLSADSQS